LSNIYALPLTLVISWRRRRKIRNRTLFRPT